MKEKKAISTGKSSAPIGLYSQAIETNGFVFTSGQINSLPDGTMVGGTFKEQARQALENLKAVVEASGAKLSDVAKVTVYLTDMGNYADLNEAYAEFFKAPFPARAVVQVTALPKGSSLEIEAVAAKEIDRG